MVATVTPKKLYRGTPGPGTTTPVFRAVGTVNWANTVTSANAPIPAGVVQDDCIVFIMYAASGISAPVTPSGWTQLLFTANAGGQVYVMAKFGTSADASANTQSVTWTGSANFIAYTVVYSGVDSVDSLVVASPTSNNGTGGSTTLAVTPPAPLVVPPSGGSYMQYTTWFTNATGPTVTTPPTGMTVRRTLFNTQQTAVGYEQANGPGNQSLVWNTTNQTLAVTLFLYAPQSATTTAYTVPGATTTSVTNITMTNPTPRSASVAVSLGGVPLFAPQVLQPVGQSGSVLDVELKQVLAAADTITVGASAGVAVHISGAEMT